MYPQNDLERRGRPVVGSEAKSVTIKFRIEPTLKDELTYSCRVHGISVTEGIRRGIIMFIRETNRRYY